MGSRAASGGVKELMNPLLSLAGQAIREARPKQIALSGPAGFLGSRVLATILDAHDYRREHRLEPGEVVLLSSSPGNLMSRLTAHYGGGPPQCKVIC